MPEAEFTGERVVPGLVDINLFNEHLSRYLFACRFATGKRVLDAGCGSGYGAAELAAAAAEVTAIDAAPDAIAYAQTHYARPNIHFAQGLLAALPDGPFDLVAAFEVIEHLEDWPAFLRETARVLAPAGLFLVSTPNRLYYADSRRGSGANPFHVHEFEFAEFRDALNEVFPHVALFTQNHTEAIVFAPLHHGPVEAALGAHDAPAVEAHFFVALCSREPIPSAPAFVWVPSDANLLRERERHIELQAGEIRLKTEWMARQKAELDQRNVEYEQLLAEVRELNEEVRRRNQWALECQAEADRRGRIALEQQEDFARESARFRDVAATYEIKLAELEDINIAKTNWALDTEQRLTAEIADRTRDLAQCVEVLHQVERTLDERTAWAQSLDREIAAAHSRYDAIRATRWARLGTRLRLLDPR